jgi:membrane protease YdiL (CAAX protease family)
MRSLVRRHQLAVFFILAFALSWWPWPMTRLNPDSIAMIPWGPALAALIVASIGTGATGVADLLRGLGRWKVRPRWYLAALGIPLGAWALAAAVTWLFLDGQVMGFVWIDVPIFAISLFTTGIINGPLTEELAWRGFALPRMLARLRPLTTSLSLGLVWFVWHLPLLVTDPTRPTLPFAASVLSFSVILTWLYLGTGGSVLIAVLFHAAVNTTAAAIVPAFGEGDRLAVWWVFVAVVLIVAVLASRSLLFRTPLRAPEGSERQASARTASNERADVTASRPS